jgi:hypothetical protein
LFPVRAGIPSLGQKRQNDLMREFVGLEATHRVAAGPRLQSMAPE